MPTPSDSSAHHRAPEMNGSPKIQLRSLDLSHELPTERAEIPSCDGVLDNQESRTKTPGSSDG
ncbi:hypothetical protein GCM10010166_67900 [Couchioplanes caeruleus subsp. azureus]|nr:hypothetical protein GCM10010166_67900 [Couchioplanes caeruleus subsp. azureus]